MNRSLPLDSLGDIDCELYAVVAERAGSSCSIDSCTAAAAKDSVDAVSR